MLVEVRPAPFAFICYPRTEQGFVDALARGLGERDLGVWYDVDVPSGERFVTVIAERLATADAVIVVMAGDAGDHTRIRRS
jgi:hypothetical protein